MRWCCLGLSDMPQYAFTREDNPSVSIELFYHMNDAPSVGKVVTVEGVKWRRVFTLPQASIDTRVDPYSAKDFAKATNKRGSMGDLWDRSKEMSLKRADKEGTDTVRESYFDNYSKRRRGTVHPERKRAQTVANLAKKGIKVDYGSDD